MIKRKNFWKDWVTSRIPIIIVSMIDFYQTLKTDWKTFAEAKLKLIRFNDLLDVLINRIARRGNYKEKG